MYNRTVLTTPVELEPYC